MTETPEVVALGNGAFVSFDGRGTGQGTGVGERIGLKGVEVTSPVSLTAGDNVASSDAAEREADVILGLGSAGLEVSGGLTVIFPDMDMDVPASETCIVVVELKAPGDMDPEVVLWVGKGGEGI